MKIEVKSFDSQSKKAVKELDLPEEVFGYPYREHLIHLAVKAYLAAQRGGNHKVKSRREVRGSTRKPFRQKGTGRARAGDIRSPLRAGGGIAHGPQVRSHSLGLTPREKRNALKSVLSRKLKDQGIIVVENLELDDHKTAGLARRLGKLGVEGKALLVDRYDNRNLSLAARNNPRLKTVDALSVNVYDVIDRELLVCTERALDRLVEVLSK